MSPKINVFDIGEETPSRMFGYYLAVGDFDSAVEWGKIKAHQDINQIAAKHEKILERKIGEFDITLHMLIPGKIQYKQNFYHTFNERLRAYI